MAVMFGYKTVWGMSIDCLGGVGRTVPTGHFCWY